MEKGMTRITNLNEYPYEENFKGNRVYIAPGKSIEMESGDALLFKGTMGIPPRIENGVPDPRTFKKLKFETSAEVKRASVEKNKCHACGQSFRTKKMLDEHISTAHGDLLEGTRADGTTGDE